MAREKGLPKTTVTFRIHKWVKDAVDKIFEDEGLINGSHFEKALIEYIGRDTMEEFAPDEVKDKLKKKPLLVKGLKTEAA
jgi:hypothetical protein